VTLLVDMNICKRVKREIFALLSRIVTSAATVTGSVSPTSVTVGTVATLTAVVTTDGTTAAPDGTPVTFNGTDANNNPVTVTSSTTSGTATASFTPTAANGIGNIDWTATALGVTSPEFALTPSPPDVLSTDLPLSLRVRTGYPGGNIWVNGVSEWLDFVQGCT